MTRTNSLFAYLVALGMLAVFSRSVRGEETKGETQPTIESLSPDGRFAFCHTPKSETKGEAYDLIRQRTGEALARLAEADVDPGPSERFHMEVSWRPDSKAFALIATLWKRGSGVSVYRRDGDTFREVRLPAFLAEIPDRVKKGRRFPHVVELNSQSVKRWRKDGSLVVEIENIEDGDGSTATANRTVILGFTPSGRVRVLKSTIRFKVEVP